MADKIIIGVLRALLTADTAQFEQGMRRASSGLKTFGKDLTQAGRQSTQIGGALTRSVTLPLVGLGAAVAKVAIDFESSFTGVRKTVEATEPEFQKMAASFRSLSREIPVSVTELNKLGEAAGALGIPKEEIVDFTRVMAELGVTTNVTSEQAAEDIAKIQNIFGRSGKDTRNFGSALVDLGNKSASTESQILELAQRIASAGHTVGLTQAEVLGFASAIANVGIDAEAGGSAISRTFVDIATAVSKGGRELERFAVVAGMSGEDFAKTFQTDAKAAVLAFIEGLGQIQTSGGDLIKTLAQLGFTEVRQTNLLRALALSGDNLSKSLNIANDAWRANSALQTEAERRFATTASELKVLWQTIQDIGITIGTSFLPMIRDVARELKAMMPFVDGVAKLFEKMPAEGRALLGFFGGILAVSGPLLYFFGQLAFAIGAISSAFGKGGFMAKAMTGTITVFGKEISKANIALGVFRAALRVITIPLALYELHRIFSELSGLIVDREKQRVGALREQTTALLSYANASRIAGREVKNLSQEEVDRINRWDAQRQRMAKFGGMDPQWSMNIAQSMIPLSKAGLFVRNYVAELQEAQNALNGLKDEQRRQLAAAQELNKSTEEQIEILERFGIPASLAEAVLALFNKQQKETAREASDLKKWIEANADQLERLDKSLKDAEESGVSMAEFLKIYGDETEDSVAKAKIFGQVVPDRVMKAAAAMGQLSDKARELNLLLPFDASKLDFPAPDPFLDPLPVEEINKRLEVTLERRNKMEEEAAEFAIDMAKRRGASEEELFALTEDLEVMKRDAAIRTENLRFQLSVQNVKDNTRLFNELKTQHEAMIAAINEDWAIGSARRAALFQSDLEKMFRSVVGTLREASIGKLGTLFFGNLGRDVDSELHEATDKAKAHLLELQDSGKASAEAITLALRRVREAQEKEQAGFAQRWKEFWRGLQQTVVRVLDEILSHFITDFLKGMLRSLGAAKLGQAFANALTGGAAGAVLGGGTAAVVGGAGFVGAEVAAVEAAALGGAGAGGVGATIAGLATNPITIAAAAAVGLGLLIGKKGLFRGGEEALHVNPRRDAFIGQFGIPGTGPNSGFHRLAALLTSITGQSGGGSLFSALRSADSKNEFEAAQAGIVGLLGRHGKRVQSFALGGFVAPGDVVPAILHGGSHGEAVVPLGDSDSEAQTGSWRRNTVVQNITIQGVLDRESAEQVWREHILPLERRAAILNTDQVSAERNRRGRR